MKKCPSFSRRHCIGDDVEQHGAQVCRARQYLGKMPAHSTYMRIQLLRTGSGTRRKEWFFS